MNNSLCFSLVLSFFISFSLFTSEKEIKGTVADLYEYFALPVRPQLTRSNVEDIAMVRLMSKSWSDNERAILQKMSEQEILSLADRILHPSLRANY